MKFFIIFISFCFSFLGYSQQTNDVDFLSAKVHIQSIVPKNKQIAGSVTYSLKVLKDVDSIYLDAKDFLTLSGSINAKGSVFKSYKNNRYMFRYPFKKGEELSIMMLFSTKPKKAMYFVDWDFESNSEAKPQVWTQGQGKYTSNWLPSIDDVNEKIEFDISVTFDENYQVISNGNLISKQSKNGLTQWNYNMDSPMSSYLVALSIGEYDKFIDYSKRGTPLECYYYKGDTSRIEPTYRYTKKIFDFLEQEIGEVFPWQNYKQVPVKDFMYGGMENTTCTIFNDMYYVDSVGFNDLNYVNINAHELAHQWFGDLVTEVSSEHHWLQEGFATYYALLAEKEVFGEGYYYEQLYDYAQELLVQDKSGKSTALVNPKSSSLTFYKKGAWVLHLLREKVGDRAFRLAVKRYLNTYKFKNVTISDFISEVEKTSKTNLKSFVDKWLISKEFHYDLIQESLAKSTFYQELEMVDCEAQNSKCQEWLNSGVSIRAKTKIIKQRPDLITSKNFHSPLEIRKVIAKSLKVIPLNLKEEFESLLDDDSYITKEIALFKLWMQFPQDRKAYLDKTKAIEGNYSKNIRMLWLALALNTKDYLEDGNLSFYKELVSYTSPLYDSNVRDNAFSYLTEINAYNEEAIVNLHQGTTHYNWRFKKACKHRLEQLSSNPKYKEIIETLNKTKS